MGGLRELVRLIRAALDEFTRDNGKILSAALVYYSTLSTVPLLLILFALPGLVLRFIGSRGDGLIAIVERIFGDNWSQIFTDYLIRVQERSLIAVIIGMVMLLYSASSVFRFLRASFRQIWQSEVAVSAANMPPLERLRQTAQQTVLDRLFAFSLVFASGLLALSGIVIFALASAARTLLHYFPLFDFTLNWLVGPLSLLALYTLTALLLLKVLPPVRMRWRDIWFPALVCAVAFLLTTYGLIVYIRYFSAANVYGAIGTLFTFQIWTLVNSMVLFFCAELCKVLVRSAASITGLRVDQHLS